MGLVRLRNPRAEPRRCSRRPLIAAVGPLLVGAMKLGDQTIYLHLARAHSIKPPSRR